MRITEIYISIQGETQYAGLPCTLVRTTGCDLRCGYCDSAFAFHGGTDMSLDQIMAEVAPAGRAAGAADGRRADAPARAAGRWRSACCAGGYRVMIETSGAHPLDALPGAVVRVIDVKTPGSGESHRNRPELLRGLRPGRRGQVRPGGRGRLHAGRRRLIREHELGGRAEVLLSPVHGRLDPKDLVGWMLRDRLPARLNLQLHKYIWEPETRRV